MLILVEEVVGGHKWCHPYIIIWILVEEDRILRRYTYWINVEWQILGLNMGISSLLPPNFSPLFLFQQHNNNNNNKYYYYYSYRTKQLNLKYIHNRNGTTTTRLEVFGGACNNTFRRTALPESRNDDEYDKDDDDDDQGNTATIVSACFVGLLTGISVVFFNNLVSISLPISLYFLCNQNPNSIFLLS